MRLAHRFIFGCLLILGSVAGHAATPVVDWVATNGDSVFLNGSEATSSPIAEDADADTLVGSFPAVTLGVDDSITLTGAFNVTGRAGSIPGNQMRWALFDAPGVPTTGQGSGYVGVWATIAGGAAVSNIRTADGSTDNPFSGGATTIIADATGTGGLAQPDTTYSFSLTIRRVDDSQIAVTAMITDGVDLLIEWEEVTASAAPASFTYDSVGILVGGTTNASRATFTDIEVSTGEPDEIFITEIEYDKDGEMIALTFTSEPGKQYTVEGSANLRTWPGDLGDDVAAATDGEETRYEFPTTNLGEWRFFRVRENPQ